jgi:hypothetical protein
MITGNDLKDTLDKIKQDFMNKKQVKRRELTNDDLKVAIEKWNIKLITITPELDERINKAREKEILEEIEREKAEYEMKIKNESMLENRADIMIDEYELNYDDFMLNEDVYANDDERVIGKEMKKLADENREEDMLKLKLNPMHYFFDIKDSADATYQSKIRNIDIPEPAKAESVSERLKEQQANNLFKKSPEAIKSHLKRDLTAQEKIDLIKDKVKG